MAASATAFRYKNILHLRLPAKHPAYSPPAKHSYGKMKFSVAVFLLQKNISHYLREIYKIRPYVLWGGANVIVYWTTPISVG